MGHAEKGGKWLAFMINICGGTEGRDGSVIPFLCFTAPNFSSAPKESKEFSAEEFHPVIVCSVTL